VTESERQELREWAARVMGWIAKPIDDDRAGTSVGALWWFDKEKKSRYPFHKKDILFCVDCGNPYVDIWHPDLDIKKMIEDKI
jgi:hypothetical protein